MCTRPLQHRLHCQPSFQVTQPVFRSVADLSFGPSLVSFGIWTQWLLLVSFWLKIFYDSKLDLYLCKLHPFFFFSSNLKCWKKYCRYTQILCFSGVPLSLQHNCHAVTQKKGCPSFLLLLPCSFRCPPRWDWAFYPPICWFRYWVKPRTDHMVMVIPSSKYLHVACAPQS